ncbi:tRNA1(Val) (adenine(37)-N6)-methyltransferase [Aliibacillus thermotolerans]|uniref:tRNA1(Val) (Adenine(37)-N6)-methyltransferase n=1 Tax=Aliibacillus thermotolerans TaxID=1834418 RepID=A0ABW0U8F8_9BACI|nr:tRNA1(Val) (adenine(37)-N6)-methyltransferase [Aliibacillus thermotolerans]MDA3128875.1 methyltransferase [Aliibacillus thermotolerans]
MMILDDNERLDYVSDSLHIIQSNRVFAFSIDAVLLARFCSVPKTRGKIIDLCSGNGIIPLVLSTRSTVPMIGIEIQARLVDMAQRSIRYNRLENQITMMKKDVRDVLVSEVDGEAELVTCNPPYFKTARSKEWNDNPYLTIARHERNGTLDEIVQASARLVKEKGKVAMVLRPERLLELMDAYRKYHIEPKRLLFVHPKKQKNANIVLLEGIKHGKPGLKTLPALVVYDENGNYTEEFQRYYEGK